MMKASLHGFALWFDVSFGGNATTSSDTQSELSIDISLFGDVRVNGVHQRKSVQNLYIYFPLEVKQYQLIVVSRFYYVVTE